MKDILTIIIPTFNNPQFLNPCVASIMRTGILNGFAKVIIVNNGDQPLKKEFEGFSGIEVIDTGKNLGWEGGLKEGLKHATSKFVCFQNDDTHIPPSQSMFYERLICRFADPSVAAVGPITTCAAGWHSIYRSDVPSCITIVPYLIFFTVIVKREDLEAVGGVDDTLPGGDDIDLSIRFRKAGKKLLVDPSAFIIHHGFKTGERVHGGPGVNGGWNSPQMSEKTNSALIKKHGFKAFFGTVHGQSEVFNIDTIYGTDEHTLINQNLTCDKDSKIVELGCGGKKVFKDSIGVDRVPNGYIIPNLNDTKSVADVEADVTGPLPFKDEEFDVVISQHIIEHCVDVVWVLKEWSRILKQGGTMVISTPNESITRGITLNPEHCHTFTADSLNGLMELLGFKQTKVIDPGNGMSFIAMFEKQPVMAESVA